MLKYQIFVKIRPVQADLLHAEGRTDGLTDMNEASNRFSQFPEPI